MATFDQINASEGITFIACQSALENEVALRPVTAVPPLVLGAEDSALFVAWAGSAGWRDHWELEMRSLSEDLPGQALVSAWVDLVMFRRDFCGAPSGLTAIDALLSKLHEAVATWGERGVELVQLQALRIDAKKMAPAPLPAVTRLAGAVRFAAVSY